MKSNFRILILICFLLGSISAAFSQNKTADETAVKELKAIYKEFDADTKTCDLKVTEKYLDESFEQKNGETKISRAEIIDRLKQSCRLFEVTALISEIEKIEVRDDGSYFLEVKNLMKGTIKTPDGKTLPFELTGRSTDIWKKTPNGWKEKTQIIHNQKMLIDGEQVFVN